MNAEILSRLRTNPIIASVRNETQLERALDSKSEIIFIINSDIKKVVNQARKATETDKMVFVHVDVIYGFSSSPLALEYICSTVKIDGIITTKKALVNKARTLGIASVLRVFAVDSPTVRTSSGLANDIKPDLLEVLPGIAPKAIRYIKKQTSIPVISGGFIETKEEIIDCIRAGAVGVSTSSANLIIAKA